MTERELKEKAQEQKRAYQRDWYARNRDKAKDRNRRYWERKALAAEQQSKPQEG